MKLSRRDSSRKLIGFAYANWAQDKINRKSNSGYIFQLFGAPISWECNRQSCVSLSSIEAEYVALAEATMRYGCIMAASSA